MNSGAPASTAPPDFSSLGIIASQSAMRVAYCDAGKNLGVYFPAGAAAFSLCTIWWTYSAAAAGITCSTELLAAPTASVLKTSRRLMPSFIIFRMLLLFLLLFGPQCSPYRNPFFRSPLRPSPSAGPSTFDFQLLTSQRLP